ncbi:MAG: hypothetical protein COB53_10080 [Elusimicrobia bacterium]|nr:MAG: hypothetical protein COB53_10080 [Elusimicrobiota bacterium]
MTTANLEPGTYTYKELLDGIRCGRWSFARIRSASGRLNFLIGITRQQLQFISREAKSRRIGLAIIGSRVSGPRSHQRSLHPALEKALPLHATKRVASYTYPGANGVKIDKTVIKEHGLDSVHTSDMSIVLIDPENRPAEELERISERMEKRLKILGTSFPIKVFPGLDGKFFTSEAEILAHGARYLAKSAPSEKDEALRSAFSELYATINIAQPLFQRTDFINGLWGALLASVSFSIALGFHPVVPAVAFLFGLYGRYLARLKSWIAAAPVDTPWTNTLALAADAGIGLIAMAGIIVPAAQYGIPFERIAVASVLHTLSKGSIRLWFDKHFSQKNLDGQRKGVFLSLSVNFIIGLLTAYVYAGRIEAFAVQACIAAVGLVLVYRK